MRGYTSFVLALCSALLLMELASLRLAASDLSLADAVELERIDGALLNSKEAAMEAARQGAESGFGAYDSSHSLGACMHCPDNFCSYYLPPAPPPPNHCDALLCSSCFREEEARAAAEAGATALIRSLPGSIGDVGIGVGDPSVEPFLRREMAGRNGFALDYIRLGKELVLNGSLAGSSLTASGALPRGMVIR